MHSCVTCIGCESANESTSCWLFWHSAVCTVLHQPTWPSKFRSWITLSSSISRPTTVWALWQHRTYYLSLQSLPKDPQNRTVLSIIPRLATKPPKCKCITLSRHSLSRWDVEKCRCRRRHRVVCPVWVKLTHRHRRKVKEKGGGRRVRKL